MATEHDRMRQHLLVFDDPDKTLSAVKALRRAGYEVADVYTPFAVHGMCEALGLPETRLPYATFAGGTIGLGLGLALQIWTHTVDWPLDIGGKSNLAMPALVPVIFELVVLLAAFATVGALLVRGRLRPSLGRGMPARQPLAAVTDDRFVVAVLERDASFSSEAFARVCNRLRPAEILRSRRPS